MKNVRLIRKDESAVSPVIATILMVAITVVLAAVLYVMVSGLLTGPGATRPVVTFGNVNAVASNGFSFAVAGASPTDPAANYRINLALNTTTGTSVALASSMTVTVSGATYTVTWTDPGGERQLNGGDGFQVVKTSGNLASQTLFTFYLLYLDGTTIQTKEFRTI